MVNIFGSTEKHVTPGERIIITFELRDSAVQQEYLSWYHNSELITNLSGVIVHYKYTYLQNPNKSGQARSFGKLFVGIYSVLIEPFF